MPSFFNTEVITMCEYVVNQNICKITGNNCPWMYWCDKTHGWRPNNSMPIQCKQAKNYIPKVGRNQGVVVASNKKTINVDIKGKIYSFRNPYEEVPKVVNVKKVNGEWILAM